MTVKTHVFRLIYMSTCHFLAPYIQLIYHHNNDILKVSSSICCGLLKVFIESLTTLEQWRVSLLGFGQILVWMGLPGPAGACIGPVAAASVQAWHRDICGAQAHQLLSLCHRQLYLNIHTKCRLMCVCLAPHGVLSNRPKCVWNCPKRS